MSRPIINREVTDEELELDRVVRTGLCTRPASGPEAQSIDEAARAIVDRELRLLQADPPIYIYPMAPGGDVAGARRVRAALAIINDLENPDPWARMRKAAAILRGAA